MRYPSPADIAEMKSRGYDRVTIERAEEQSKRGVEAQDVCSVIREAFKGVALGNGVGLTEARALDDYEDAVTCAANRENDEKEDWQRITCDDLNTFRDTWSFFDAEGTRFHLPAFLIADLEDEEGFGLEFWLTHLSEHCKSQFVLLNREQRMAVRRYLLHIETDPDSSFHITEIKEALKTYWVEDPTSESPASS